MRTIKISLLFLILSISVYPQDFWQQTNGPYNRATVNDFLLYTDSTILLATNEGIVKSTNNGATWNRNSDVWDRTSCLASDKSGILYAGVKDDGDNPFLYKSTDGGANWYSMNTGFWADIKDILVNYTDTIIVGSWDKGMYRSFDRGTNWTQINNGIQHTGIYEIILLSNGYLLVGTNGGGVYKSTNWGDSWTPSGNFIRAESFCEIFSGHIFTGASTGIYYSSNYCGNWAYMGTGIPNDNTATCITYDPQGVLYAGIDLGKGVYFSSKNGNTWSYLGLGTSTRTLGWDLESRLYAGGLSSGLYRYEFEDSTWSSVYNQGYTPVEVHDLCLTKNGHILASTEWWGLYLTTNRGENWERTSYPDNEPNALESVDDSIFLCGGNFHVFTSTDRGDSWTITGDFWVGSIYYEPTEEILYLGTSDSWTDITGLYTSMDFGQTWTLLYSFPQIVSEQMIIALRVTKTKKLILASLMYHYSPPAWEDFYHFYQSLDNGQTWETVLEHDSRYVSIIEEDMSSNIYAFAGDALLISNNEGNSWITREIPPSALFALDYSGKIFRTNGNNIWYSSNQGISWLSVDNSGLQGSIYDIVINENNRIYLATENGVFYGEADSIVLSTKNIEPAKLFYLFQNYPNPFNPTTSLQYAIGSRQFVTLKVFDLLGREIATLVNEEKTAGEYEVEFNAVSHSGLPSGEVRNLTSGIYFYQLKAGSFVETKKMVLLK